MSWWTYDGYQYEEEYNDERAFAIPFARKIAGNLNSPSDVDWYAVELERYETFRVTFEGGNYQPGMYNVTWYTPSMQLVAQTNITTSTRDGPSTQVYEMQTPDVSGSYYLRVQPYSSTTHKSSMYKIAVDSLGSSVPVISLERSESSIPEGDDASTAATITLLLDRPSATHTVVHYTVRSGTATVASPYGSDVVGTISGSVTFAPGETSATIAGTRTVPDPFSEDDEYFWVDFDGITVGAAKFPGDVGTLSAQVTILNDDFVPVATSARHAVPEDGTLRAALIASDRDDASLSYEVVDIPSHGVVTLEAGGIFEYRPFADYAGPDSFTFRASDSVHQSGLATVSLDIAPTDDAPIAENGSSVGSEDLPVSGVVVAFDPDASNVSPTLSRLNLQTVVDGTAELIVTPTGFFWVNLFAARPGAYGSSYEIDGPTYVDGIAWTPAWSTNGTRDPSTSSTYAYDLAGFASWSESTEDGGFFDQYPKPPGGGLLNRGSISSGTREGFPAIRVEDPSDGHGLYSIDLWVARPPEPVTLTFSLESGPLHGKVVLSPDGRYTYTSNVNWYGADSFTFRASDGLLKSEVGTVDLTIAPVNDSPAGSVSIEGIPVEGRSLLASHSLADVDGIGTVTYQWYADGKPIAGASGVDASMLLLDASHIGRVISARATYLDGAGTLEAVMSPSTARVAANKPPGISLTGTMADDQGLIGGDGSDTIIGIAGNDTLTGLGGDDYLDGGDGFDTAVFNGRLPDYSILREGSSVKVFDSIASRDGVDTVLQVERLQFADMSVNLTVQATAATVPVQVLDRICELYVGFFGRVPAANGLENWLHQYNAGKSPDRMADDFQSIGSSPSLRAHTGYWDFERDLPLSDQDYARIVYRNVLGREGLQSGIDYWSSQLTTGPEQKSRGELVAMMLDAAHALKGDSNWGWVADLLDDRILMSKRVAVEWGLNYATSDEQAIAKGMAIAGAVQLSTNPGFPGIPIKSFDFEAAVGLVGVGESSIQLISI